MSIFRNLNPYELHKKLINEYILKAPGDTKKLYERDTSKDKTDIDVIRENHRFLWDADPADTWEKQLAKRYYDKLFKEYCIADLSRFKENKVSDASVAGANISDIAFPRLFSWTIAVVADTVADNRLLYVGESIRKWSPERVSSFAEIRNVNRRRSSAVGRWISPIRNRERRRMPSSNWVSFFPQGKPRIWWFSLFCNFQDCVRIVRRN